MFELNLLVRLTEIGSIAAEYALQGIGSNTLCTDDNESIICEMLVSGTIICRSERGLMKVVDLIYSAA